MSPWPVPGHTLTLSGTAEVVQASGSDKKRSR